MIKHFRKWNFQILVVSLSTVCLCCGFKLTAAQNVDIVLHNDNTLITPTTFYVANLKDERENKAAVAWLLPKKYAVSGQSKAFPVDFKGGGFNMIKQFIGYKILKNTSYRPVVICLKKFITNETSVEKGMVQGVITLALSFELETADEPVYLTSYAGSMNYVRKAGNPQDIEPILRQTLENGLIYLNTWMNKQAGTNVYLATKVSLTFADYVEKTEGDTIYYNIKRPLTWDDFQSKVGNSKFDAEVLPSFGYAEKVEVVKGIINIMLDLKVFLPKSACWVKENSQNSYSLNHEQRHFDIVKIVAEHFKQKLKSENLPVRNYDGFINVDYLDAFREMNQLQKQYDDETGHGTNQGKQQDWNIKIDNELKKFGIK